MTRIATMGAALAAALGLTAFQAAGVSVSQAWSRPAAAGQTGSGYFTVTNRGKAADTLLRAETPAADRVEMHESLVSAQGVHSMNTVTSLAIPAGKSVTFGPGGYHLMLVGLKSSQALGGRVPLTLVFARAGRVRADLTVSASAPTR